jgi:hypothetical protein
VENFVFCYNPDWFHPKPGAPSTGSPIASATKYFNAMESLLRVIHRISAYALNLPDVEFFNRFYFGRQNIGAEELDEDGSVVFPPLNKRDLSSYIQRRENNRMITIKQL